MKKRLASLVLCIVLLLTYSPAIMAGTNDFPKGNIDAPKNVSASVKSTDNSTIDSYALGFSIPSGIPALNDEWAIWSKSNTAAENMSINLEYDYKLNDTGNWHCISVFDKPESFKLTTLGANGEVSVKPAALTGISNKMSTLDSNTIYFRCRFTVTFYDKSNGVTIKSVSPWSESAAAAKNTNSGEGTASSTTTGISQASTITDGLVARYTFDGNLNDSVNGNNGVQMGNIGFVNGVSGSAASFDGKSWIEANSISALNLSHKFTVSVWLYKNYDNDAGSVPIVEKEKSFILSEYLMRPRFYFYADNGDYDKLECSQFIDIHKWQLLTVSYDGDENIMNYYVDGQLTDSPKHSGSGALPITDGKLIIGKMVESDQYVYYKGCLDDLRIYNKALDMDQVKSLYDEMANGPEKNLINHPNKLVAWYKFNGDTKDSSGFANDAKYVGSVVPVFTDAIQGKGLVLNGSSYLEVADNDAQELDKGFTFSAWVCTAKKNIINDDSYPIFAKTKCSAYTEMPSYQFQYRHFGDNNERIDFYGTDQVSSSSTGEIEQDITSAFQTWKMITVTNNGAQTKLYVNGKFIGLSDYKAPLLHSGGKLYIGKSAFGSEGSVFFIGSLDELRIYNYALTEIDVQNLYKYRDSIVVTPNATALQALKSSNKTVKLKVSLVPPEKASVTDITSRVKYATSAARVFTAANGIMTIKGKGKGNLTLTLGPLSATVPVTVK